MESFYFHGLNSLQNGFGALKRNTLRNYQKSRPALYALFMWVKRFYRDHLHYEVRGELFYVRLLLSGVGVFFVMSTSY